MEIVKVRATDWSHYGHMRDVKEKLNVIEVEVVGFIVAEDEEKICIAHQWFPREESSDDVRNVTVIPKANIKSRITYPGPTMDGED